MFNRKAMRDERYDVHFPFREQMQKGFHVPRFRPAHIADGIVAAFLLISGVISARAIGTGNPEVEFLLVVRLAFDIDADRSHGNNNRAVARDSAGQIDRLAAGSFSSNEN